MSSVSRRLTPEPFGPALSLLGAHPSAVATTSCLTTRSQACSGRLSSHSDRTPCGDGGSSWPAISADGRYVGFSSAATNLVAGDTNGVAHIFVHDRDEPPPPQPVGGMAELPHVSGLSGSNHVPLAEVAAVALVAHTATAWYARRRWDRPH